MAENCPFLDYNRNSGLFGATYCCRKTARDIRTGEKLLEDYCQAGEKYFSQCPDFKPQTESSGGCYLTSACTEAMGFADDCSELTILRDYRDHWLANQPFGHEEIAEYYRIAPGIIDAIHKKKDSIQILKQLYEEMIVPCVQFIKEKRFEEAHELYRSKTQELRAIYKATD